MFRERLFGANEGKGSYRALERCLYCSGVVVKRGVRKKRFEAVQIYYCKKCDKRFTSLITKHKKYPLGVVIWVLTLYNRLYSVAEIPPLIKERFGIQIRPGVVSGWLGEYAQYARFLRMRGFASEKYGKQGFIEESKLFHRQVYNFKYHRAKLDLILNEEFRHFRFRPLQEFLELAVAECPHQVFQNSNKRASEFKNAFSLERVKIVPKGGSSAVKLAGFVLQAVSNNKARHEALQDFMLFNDSVTVAVELAVLIGSDDLRHFKHELGFDVPIALKDGEYITGHIDVVQVRNGLIYIMDFKPSASRERPVDQLTIYALALSRLTGIRLYHMRCAWFDDKDYYEFFPLHVVYKLKGKRLPRGQMRLA